MLRKKTLAVLTFLIVFLMPLVFWVCMLHAREYDGGNGEKCYKSLFLAYSELRRVAFLGDKEAVSKLIYKFESKDEKNDSHHEVSGTLKMKNLDRYVKDNPEYQIAQPALWKEMFLRVGRVDRYGYMCDEERAHFILATDAVFEDKGRRIMRYELFFGWQGDAWKVMSGQPLENDQKYSGLLKYFDQGVTWVNAGAQ